MIPGRAEVMESHEQHIEFDIDGSSQPPDSFCWGFLQKTDLFSRCLNNIAKVEARRGDGDLSAGHVGRYISLANPDRMSQAMCHLPSAILLTIWICTITALIFYPTGYIVIFGLVSLHMFFFCWHMGIGTLYGVYKMRQAARQDWNRTWDEYLVKHPGVDESMLHVVMLPNYKEDEQMLSQTVSNLAESDMAKKYMLVVLAMEAREGDDGREKAERLIRRHKSEFMDVIATFHPSNIPCEVAGKSSNTQWAFREVQRWYGSHVSESDGVHDASKVFLTVADADSLHHKDYFTKLSVEGLSLSTQERSWAIWQAPILLLRNFETVPNLVRITGYGTFLYEISGQATSSWLDHPCFSAYSMTLALANNPLVDGWDADVIAEDHHMYLKCMFASYWEEIFSKKAVENPSKLQLRPIWLPVTSYLAEDPNGWIASLVARYQQARRHSQGVAELSYLVLQYVTIALEHRMPWKAHLQIWFLIQKFCTIHIWNGFQSFLSIFTTIVAIYWCFQKMYQGNLTEKVVEFVDDEVVSDTHWITTAVFILVAGFAPILGIVLGAANCAVVKDSVEGRYCPLYLQSITDPDRAHKKTHTLCLKELGILCFKVLSDAYTFGQATVVLYGLFPVMQAATSLSLYGHKFEYICAAKPEGSRGCDGGKKSQMVQPSEFGLPEELEQLA